MVEGLLVTTLALAEPAAAGAASAATPSYKTPLLLARAIPLSVSTAYGLFLIALPQGEDLGMSDASDVGDALSKGAFVAAVGGIFGGWLAPPVVHVVHGNFGRSFLSLGVGAGATLMGLIFGLGVSAYHCDQPHPFDSDCITRTIGYAFVGASLFQAFWMLVEVHELSDSRAATASLSLVPRISYAPSRSGGGQIGVELTF